MADAPTSPSDSLALDDAWARLVGWLRREPLQAALLLAVAGVLVYFFGFFNVFVDGAQSTAVWAKKSWNSENDLEHGMLIVPIAIFIVWYHAAELIAAPKRESWSGLIFVLIGVVLFVLSVRTLQPRIAMLSAPVLLYGITRYLWGPATARIVIFPCAFLLFAIPVGFLVSRTVALQTMAANVAASLSNLIGIHVIADGATIAARDNSFHFEVAGGCSGIRSLTAMTMLAALYVHFTQKETWKKVVIFGSSLGFALIGNLFRLFSVVLFAHFINAEIAGNQYHDYSGFVFFPIAVAAMVGFSNLLNRNWNGIVREALKPEPLLNEPASASSVPATAATAAKAKSSEPNPASYDY